MSDINQPCPTICSACGRTSGKCESCIKVDAVLKPERIDQLHAEARKAWGDQIGSEPTIADRFARAISRDVVAILAEDQANPRDGHERPRAWRDVLAERRRQISAEGWTPEHDDEHRTGSMATAAACYALFDSPRPVDMLSDCGVHVLWSWTGWAEKWFKPKDARSNLIRAGALILAEIERLDRATTAASGIGESDGG